MTTFNNYADKKRGVGVSIKSMRGLGWFKTPVSSQTHKLMAATNFFDYLGLKHYEKAKKNKTFQSFKIGPAALKF